jgi:hypothetical protein
MAKIEQMDQLVMNIGVENIGCSPCQIYSVISLGVQTFHLFCLDDDVRSTETLNELIEWYWQENSVHHTLWTAVCERFSDKNLYLKDERNFYFKDNEDTLLIQCKMFEVAYYFAESENPTFLGFVESLN